MRKESWETLRVSEIHLLDFRGICMRGEWGEEKAPKKFEAKRAVKTVKNCVD